MSSHKPRRVFHINVAKHSKKEVNEMIKKLLKRCEKNRVYVNDIDLTRRGNE